MWLCFCRLQHACPDCLTLESLRYAVRAVRASQACHTPAYSAMPVLRPVNSLSGSEAGPAVESKAVLPELRADGEPKVKAKAAPKDKACKAKAEQKKNKACTAKAAPKDKAGKAKAALKGRAKGKGGKAKAKASAKKPASSKERGRGTVEPEESEEPASGEGTEPVRKKPCLKRPSLGAKGPRESHWT